MSNALLDIHALRQTFPRADGGEHLVLDGIELKLIEARSWGFSAARAPANRRCCARSPA